MAVRGGSRERASNIPFSLYCCVLLKNIDTHKHTYNPFPFSSSLSLLNECLGGEKRGGGS